MRGRRIWALVVLLGGCSFDSAGSGQSGSSVGSGSTGGAGSEASSGTTGSNGPTDSSTTSPGTTASTTETTTSGTTQGTTTTDDGSTGEQTATTGGCVPEAEVCDAVDNDCDGLIDEGSPDNSSCQNCEFVLSNDGSKYFGVCGPSSTWDAARAACQAFGTGMDLAKIDNAEDQATLNGLTSADHWIGLTDSAEEGRWVWLDGTVSIMGGVKQPYDGWFGDQPNGTTDQNCGQLDEGDAAWADQACSDMFPFICEHAV